MSASGSVPPLDDAPLLERAVRAIQETGILMDYEALAADVALLAAAFPDTYVFCSAVANTVKAISDVMGDRVTHNRLRRELSGWDSYHYQHIRTNNQEADMRLVYRRIRDRIEVAAFGHRFVPRDIYGRVLESMAEL